MGEQRGGDWIARRMRDRGGLRWATVGRIAAMAASMAGGWRRRGLVGGAGADKDGGWE